MANQLTLNILEAASLDLLKTLLRSTTTGGKSWRTRQAERLLNSSGFGLKIVKQLWNNSKDRFIAPMSILHGSSLLRKTDLYCNARALLMKSWSRRLVAGSFAGWEEER